MKLYLKKGPGGVLVPDDDESAEWIQKLKIGDVVSAEVRRPRNYRFFKKYMALLRHGFEAWEPASSEYKGMPAVKNFVRFRKDIAIATGHYVIVVSIKGEARAEADSISFASMTEETFDRLYQKTITLLLHKYQVFYRYRDAEEVDRAINDILRFS